MKYKRNPIPRNWPTLMGVQGWLGVLRSKPTIAQRRVYRVCSFRELMTHECTRPLVMCTYHYGQVWGYSMVHTAGLCYCTTDTWLASYPELELAE